MSNRRVFGGRAGSPHFDEIEQQDNATFRRSDYFLEISPKVELQDLLDPSKWGVQRLLKRGDRITALRVDDAWVAELLVVGTVSGYPQIIVVSSMSPRPAEVQTAYGVEQSIEDGRWRAFIGNKIIAEGLERRPQAQEKLDEALARSSK
jgi:hypothetical protein